MIIGKDTGQIAVNLNSPGPVFLTSISHQVQLGCANRIRSERWRWGFADVVVHHAAITHRIQGSDYSATIGTLPNANVEWNADRSLFRRAGAADVRRRLPRRRKFLG